MKNLRLLGLPIGGFILFVIALLLSPPYIITRNILLIVAALLTLVFYFITFLQVIKNFSWNSSRKLLWLVIVISLPVIGNVIYVIFNETANRRQQPHGIW